MQQFTQAIVCEFANDGKSLTLCEGFCYYLARPRGVISRIVVPKGFKSDGFSNFGFNFIVPKFGKGLKCAVLHDYLCEGFHKGLNSRRFADEIFLEAMLQTKAFSKPKAYLLYFLVRAFAKVKGYL